MLTDETRARLRRLARRKYRRNVSAPATQPIETHSNQQGPPTDSLAKSSGWQVAEDDAQTLSRFAAAEEVTTPAGKHLLLQHRVSDLWPGISNCSLPSEKTGMNLDWISSVPSSQNQQSRRNKSQQNKARQDKKIAEEYTGFLAAFPHQCLFLDLETCGFAGSMIFLAGVIHEWAGTLRISQLWARNYAEERSLLHTLRLYTANATHLVTFNGKSFDWPQVRDRCILHERSPDASLPNMTHIDLLHLARRRWKHQLPDCKLQTLEKLICHRFRTGDIPGRDIPEVYQHYVRSGDATRVGTILHHNGLDLITLLQLSLRIGSD